MITKTLNGCQTTIKPFTWADRPGRPHNHKSYQVTIREPGGLEHTSSVRGPAAAVEVRRFYSFMLRPSR
jgi:hypothetical protein